MIPRSASALDPAVLAPAAGWSAAGGAVVVVARDGLVAGSGPVDERRPWASVTKPCTALAVLLAAADGLLGLDEPAGPAGATVRHLLAHAAGLAFDAPVALAPPERTRTYSNAGYDLLGELVERRSGLPFERFLDRRVLAPLGMTGTRLEGRPSDGLAGPAADLASLAHGLLAPGTALAGAVAAAATVAYPGLRGVLPGVGPFEDLTWGLGCEVRGSKDPHWTARACSPATFGHFGRSGAFLWVDPVAGIALAGLSGRAFGPWALGAWPALGDAVLAATADRRP